MKSLKLDLVIETDGNDIKTGLRVYDASSHSFAINAVKRGYLGHRPKSCYRLDGVYRDAASGEWVPIRFPLFIRTGTGWFVNFADSPNVWIFIAWVNHPDKKHAKEMIAKAENHPCYPPAIAEYL